jgi:hypothetical protein
LSVPLRSNQALGYIKNNRANTIEEVFNQIDENGKIKSDEDHSNRTLFDKANVEWWNGADLSGYGEHDIEIKITLNADIDRINYQYNPNFYGAKADKEYSIVDMYPSMTSTLDKADKDNVEDFFEVANMFEEVMKGKELAPLIMNDEEMER